MSDLCSWYISLLQFWSNIWSVVATTLGLWTWIWSIQDTVEWYRKWLVDFNAGKTQPFLFDRSKNTGAIDVKMDGSQSFLNKNHCKCYKKFASRSWPMLLTLPNFFLMNTLLSFARKSQVAAIAVFPSKLDHRPLFNDIYYKFSLVPGFAWIWLTDATRCL